MTNPYAPPQAIVQDIADSRVLVMPADRGTRLGAAILDAVILFGMVYLPFLVAAIGQGMASGDTETFEEDINAITIVGLVLTAIGFGAWCWLTILYVKRNGQSIAKKLLGIKVVRSDGSAASLGRIFWLRNVVNGLLGIIPLYGLIDVLFIFGETRQCLHDKIADTIVVRA
jgi:uncharacterized RDD family membrane protein YckC